ncbi:MAG: hypothetical protein ACKVP3_23085 [Hyphomicrobiaceae bacterium]
MSLAHDVPNSGHNGPPTFQDDIDAVLQRGTLRVSLERLRMAIRDRRLIRGHLLVVDSLIEDLNSESGVAWPSRKTLAQFTGLSEKSVGNLLFDLRNFGYVSWEKRPNPYGKGRPLLHYTFPIRSRSLEELQAAIQVSLDRLKSTARPWGRSTAQPAGQFKASTAQPVRQSAASDCPASKAVVLPSRPGAETSRYELGGLREKNTHAKSAKSLSIVDPGPSNIVEPTEEQTKRFIALWSAVRSPGIELRPPDHEFMARHLKTSLNPYVGVPSAVSLPAIDLTLSACEASVHDGRITGSKGAFANYFAKTLASKIVEVTRQQSELIVITQGAKTKIEVEQQIAETRASIEGKAGEMKLQGLQNSMAATATRRKTETAAKSQNRRPSDESSEGPELFNDSEKLGPICFQPMMGHHANEILKDCPGSTKADVLKARDFTADAFMGAKMSPTSIKDRWKIETWKIVAYAKHGNPADLVGGTAKLEGNWFALSEAFVGGITSRFPAVQFSHVKDIFDEVEELDLNGEQIKLRGVKAMLAGMRADRTDVFAVRPREYGPDQQAAFEKYVTDQCAAIQKADDDKKEAEAAAAAAAAKRAADDEAARIERLTLKAKEDAERKARDEQRVAECTLQWQPTDTSLVDSLGDRAVTKATKTPWYVKLGEKLQIPPDEARSKYGHLSADDVKAMLSGARPMS